MKVLLDSGWMKLSQLPDGTWEFFINAFKPQPIPPEHMPTKRFELFIAD